MPGDNSIAVSLSNHLSREGERVIQRYDLQAQLLHTHEIPEDKFSSDEGPDLFTTDQNLIFFMQTQKDTSIIKAVQEAN